MVRAHWEMLSTQVLQNRVGLWKQSRLRARHCRHLITKRTVPVTRLHHHCVPSPDHRTHMLACFQVVQFLWSKCRNAALLWVGRNLLSVVNDIELAPWSHALLQSSDVFAMQRSARGTKHSAQSSQSGWVTHFRAPARLSSPLCASGPHSMLAFWLLVTRP